jgi:hypothetical protein
MAVIYTPYPDTGSSVCWRKFPGDFRAPPEEQGSGFFSCNAHQGSIKIGIQLGWIWEGEGFRVHSSRRCWLRFHWSLWIIILGVAAATLCSSHPPTHDHDVPHPPLCIDASSAVVQGPHTPVLFADRGTFPLPPKFLTLVVSQAMLASFLLVGLGLLARPLSQAPERSFLNTPHLTLAVLRL